MVEIVNLATAFALPIIIDSLTSQREFVWGQKSSVKTVNTKYEDNNLSEMFAL